MSMDADPRICLSLLYKNDPFYSLYLSDLMMAPQWVKNKFLKEQRNLSMALKKLEHQKVTRLRQLNEEQKQFGLLMKRKLVPKVTIKRGSPTVTERNSPRTLSSVNFSWLASSKSSWKSLDTKVYAKPDTGITSIVSRAPNELQTPTLKSLRPLFPSQRLEISTKQRATADKQRNPNPHHATPSTRPHRINWERGNNHLKSEKQLSRHGLDSQKFSAPTILVM